MDLMTEESMVAYFLGKLSENESRDIEEACLSNEELFSQLQSVEESLIDAYVLRQMPAENRALFERNYLNTERRRKTIELASALRKMYRPDTIASTTPTPAGPVSTGWSSLAIVHRAHRAAWASGIAAILLLVLTASLWSLWRGEKTPSLQAGGARTNPEAASLPSALPSPSSVVSLGSPAVPGISPATTASPSLSPFPENAPDVTSQPSPVFATFVLLPGGVRGGDAGQVLKLSSATTTVRLQLILREKSALRYRAELQTPEGATVFRKPALTAKTEGSRSVVVLDLPVRTLESRHYLLVLFNADESNPDEPVAEYAFKVNKQ